MSRRKYKEICVGDVYNNWTVLSFDCIKNGHKYYLCECGCSNKTVKSVCGDYLLSGRSTNCGCLRNKNNAKRCSELGKQWGSINGTMYGSRNIHFAYNANKKFNESTLIDDKIAIVLHNNTKLITFIDAEDWTDDIQSKCWAINNKGYVVCSNSKDVLHRQIMNCNDNYYDVHHIDGDKLNNCKDNLIVLTHTAHTSLHNHIDKIGKLLNRDEINDFINFKN